MENRNFYNEILTEHNMHPDFKHDIEDADIVLDGINPSCGDEIQLKLKTDGVSKLDMKCKNVEQENKKIKSSFGYKLFGQK